jgi:hypothetical protein
VDLVFICDTYHHFEFPQKTMPSIRDALRPGGQVILIDFEHIQALSSLISAGAVGLESFRPSAPSGREVGFSMFFHKSRDFSWPDLSCFAVGLLSCISVMVAISRRTPTGQQA